MRAATLSAAPPWTEAGRGPRPVDQVHVFFLTK
jgi:hypothetical protein